MAYWNNPVVDTAMALALLLLGAELLRRLVPAFGRQAVPTTILAGVVGLVLGPQVVGLLPLDQDVMEGVVYHGLAIVFIAVGLRQPAEGRGKASSGVKAFTFAIPAMEALQTVIGLGAVMVMGVIIGKTLHPGLGVMLPLGFEQGPGQALSLGAAWEKTGMQDGAQVGLIFAAIGYAWSVVVGVPLVVWGRRKGLVSTVARATSDKDSVEEAAKVDDLPGALGVLSRQVMAIAGCYAVTYAICLGVYTRLSVLPDIAPVAWGFHFVVGAGVAMGVRAFLTRGGRPYPLHSPTMGQLSGLTVDVITCAALAAVQIAVLRAHWVPIVLVTTLGGLLTLGASVWFARRAFPDEPFEHCVVWFGMSTGTLPMGLALLRAIDPDMRSSAPISAVVGSATAVPLAAPLLMFLIPGTVAYWPEDFPMAGWISLGICAAYLVVLLVLWRLFTTLRFKRPFASLWP